MISINGPTEHVGLRKVSVRRSLTDTDTWEIFVAVKNYGSKARSVPLAVQFGGAPVGNSPLRITTRRRGERHFSFPDSRRRMVGSAAADLGSIPEDNRATLELPERKLLPITVYSADPDLLRPVFTAIAGVQAVFLPPSKYDPKANGGIVLLDRFAPAVPPADAKPSGLNPLPISRPFRFANVGKLVKLKSWKVDHPLTLGLRAKDLELANAEVLKPGKDDVAVAESDQGPLIVARDQASPDRGVRIRSRARRA